MSDLNELKTKVTLPIIGTLKEAWHGISGFKASAWGGAGFLILVSSGIMFAMLIVAMIVIFGLIGSTGLSDPSQVSPNAALGIQIIMRVLSILGDFFIMPIAVGLSLLAVHRLRQQPFTAYRVFDYYKWRYMWRFFMVMLLLYAMLFVVLLGLALIAAVMIAIFHHTEMHPVLIFTLCSIAGIALFLFIAYISIGTHFANFLIADKNKGVWHAFGEGYRIAWQYYWRILGIIMLFALIALGLALACSILFFLFHLINLGWLGGLLGFAVMVTVMIWYLPWGLNIWALIYRDLFGLESQ